MSLDRYIDDYKLDESLLDDEQKEYMMEELAETHTKVNEYKAQFEDWESEREKANAEIESLEDEIEWLKDEYGWFDVEEGEI